jgi:cytochrome c biogenesis protein CcdA
MLSLLFALLAGVLTIATPCTLPVLPVLLGASVGRAGSARPIFIVLGFIVSFALAVLVFSAVTQVLDIDQNTLRTAAVVLLIAFGLTMLWPAPFEWIAAHAGGPINVIAKVPAAATKGNVGGLVVGATLGIVWTPCAGPVLGSILAVIATSTNIAWGAFLLLAYATGAAVPMLTIAYGGQFVTTRIRSVSRFTKPMQQVFGVLVIGFAVALHFQYDTLITAWLSGFYPNGQLGL